MNLKLYILIFYVSLFTVAVFAQEDTANQAAVLNQMRMKQEAEEVRVLRVIQPNSVNRLPICTEDQRVRSRLKKMATSNKGKVENFTLNAGHKSSTIQDNHGSINNSVSVQIVEGSDANENGCL